MQLKDLFSKWIKLQSEDISDHYTGTVPENVRPEWEVWIREASCQPGEGTRTLPSARRTSRPSQVSRLCLKRGCVFQNVGSSAFKLQAMKKSLQPFKQGSRPVKSRQELREGAKSLEGVREVER